MRESKYNDNTYFNNYSGDPNTSIVNSLETLRQNGFEKKSYNLSGPYLFYTIRNHENIKVLYQFAAERKLLNG